MTGAGELKLLSSVTCVKICAFMGCGDLRRVIWPERLGWIEDAAFCATGLEEAVLPEGLKGIGEDGFCNCPNLRRVVLPSTVERVGPWLASASPVFEGVVSRSPHFYVENDALICADSGALLCCWSREKNYTVPAGVRRILGFSNRFVEEICVGQPLEGVGWDAFCNCGALRKVSFADVREFRPGALNWLWDAVVDVAGERIDAVTYSHV